LYHELKPQIELRAQMSVDYGVDLRSKSDAQVAEAVIKAEIERRRGGERISKPEVKPGHFFFKPPAFIRARSTELQALLKTITESPYVVGRDGRPRPSAALANGVRVKIGTAFYKVGSGGLHSQEKKQVMMSDDDFAILDRDVTSYYPNVILGQHLAPDHLGSDFLTVYESIYRRRIAAKNSGDKNVSETLKIVLNGSFGKFGSPFSVLYSPKLLIQTTMTGQLAALMLIERLEGVHMQVVSANTDGIVAKVPRVRRSDYEAIVSEWERETGFGTEETEYKALYSRDVNNYIAITTDGKVKTKGDFAECGRGLPGAMGMKKNPTGSIIRDAVVSYLKDGVPIEATVYEASDFRRFVSVRRVNNGGAMKGDKYIGKAIRWYMGIGEMQGLTVRDNGNAVPETAGAVPCMELPNEFPLDVDHQWYVRQCYAALHDLGLDVLDPGFRGRNGRVYGRIASQSTWHAVDLPSGVARCGRQPESIRKPWLEVRTLPQGARFCAKCNASLIENASR
jgi:hypothetical protein